MGNAICRSGLTDRYRLSALCIALCLASLAGCRAQPDHDRMSGVPETPPSFDDVDARIEALAGEGKRFDELWIERASLRLDGYVVQYKLGLPADRSGREKVELIRDAETLVEQVAEATGYRGRVAGSEVTRGKGLEAIFIEFGYSPELGYGDPTGRTPMPEFKTAADIPADPPSFGCVDERLRALVAEGERFEMFDVGEVSKRLDGYVVRYNLELPEGLTALEEAQADREARALIAAVAEACGIRGRLAGSSFSEEGVTTTLIVEFGYSPELGYPDPTKLDGE